jgi:hypothetical protein
MVDGRRKKDLENICRLTWNVEERENKLSIYIFMNLQTQTHTHTYSLTNTEG